MKDQMQMILISNEEKIATKAFGGRCGDGLVVKQQLLLLQKIQI